MLAWPAEPPAQVTALEPEQGGVDFAIQGEYSGKLETVTPLGIQVVALGSGRFRALYFAGGLPEEGWDGSGPLTAEGGLGVQGADFAGPGFAAAIPTDGSLMAGRTSDGQLFSLNKVLRRSPTEGAVAPAGAATLFDGTGLSAWKPGTALMDERRLMRPEGSGAGEGAVTTSTWQDFFLHLEFRVPFMPNQSGATRGKSGVYLQGRFEALILDSFGNPGDTGVQATQACGAFREMAAPEAYPAYPPLSWQTYDVEFTAARFDSSGHTLLEPARATVRWNGTLVHDRRPLPSSTQSGDPMGPQAGPMRLQAYGDPVFFRNIWILEGKPGAGLPGEGRIHASLPREKEAKGPTFLVNGRTLPGIFADSHSKPSTRLARGYFLSTPQMGNE